MADPLGRPLDGRKTLLASLIVIGFFAALLAPNLLWLSNSTLKVANNSAWEVTEIEVEVRGGEEQVEGLPAGGKAMILLPVAGESDLKLGYRVNGSEQSCDAGYIESSGYHVIVEIRADGSAACRVERASLRRLLIFEIF